MDGAQPPSPPPAPLGGRGVGSEGVKLGLGKKGVVCEGVLVLVFVSHHANLFLTEKNIKLLFPKSSLFYL